VVAAAAAVIVVVAIQMVNISAPTRRDSRVRADGAESRGAGADFIVYQLVDKRSDSDLGNTQSAG